MNHSLSNNFLSLSPIHSATLIPPPVVRIELPPINSPSLPPGPVLPQNSFRLV